VEGEGGRGWGGEGEGGQEGGDDEAEMRRLLAQHSSKCSLLPSVVLHFVVLVLCGFTAGGL